MLLEDVEDLIAALTDTRVILARIVVLLIVREEFVEEFLLYLRILLLQGRHPLLLTQFPERFLWTPTATVFKT